MIFGPKLYTVHIDPDNPPPQGTAIFIREGFNFFAFLLLPVWTLYHRLWVSSVVIILLQIGVIVLMKDQFLSPAGQDVVLFFLQVVLGFHGNDLWRAKLQRRGYIIADIAIGENLLRAEQRFFERYLAAT